MEKISKINSPVSERKDADLLIKEKAAEISNSELIKEQILNKWYIQYRAKWVTYLYSMYQHLPIIRVNPRLNIGHEIYGLYKKHPV